MSNKTFYTALILVLTATAIALVFLDEALEPVNQAVVARHVILHPASMLKQRQPVVFKNQAENPLPVPDSAATDSTLSLIFVGDIMQHDKNIAAAYNSASGGYEYDACFQYVAPILQQVDVAVGNLELTFGGKPYRGFPSFSAPDELAAALKNAGFDYLVNANNHVLDRQRFGLDRTMDILDQHGFGRTGAFKDAADRNANHPMLIEKNGFRIALLNYTYGMNGIEVTPPNLVNQISYARVKADLQSLDRSFYDLAIVFFHWGDEYMRHPYVDQARFANYCFRNGADMVIGSHPHVLQKMVYRPFEDSTGRSRHSLIAYSLGNFISNYVGRYKNGGAMLQVNLRKQNGQVTIEQPGYYLVYVYKPVENGRKQFYILPVSQFENDMALTDTEREQMLEFANDTRQLYAGYTIGVGEYVYNPHNNKWELQLNQPLAAENMP